MNKYPYLHVKTFITVVMAIVSMVLAIVAYTELLQVSGDVYDVLDNWQQKPVVNMTLVDWGESCPDGFNAISLSNADFPGVTKGHCGCTSSLFYSSTLGNCSDEAEITAECMSYVSKGKVDVKSWRGKRLCVARGGEPAESWKDGYYQRPHPNSEGVCEKGYHRCGQGLNHNDDKAICWPDSDEYHCPMTNAVVAETIPSGDGWFLVGTFDDQYSLFGRTEGLGEFPLVDLQLKLSTNIGESFRDGVSYSSGSQDRGPCYKGTNQVLSSKFEASAVQLWKVGAIYPRSCDRVDSRYFAYDSYLFQPLYLESFRTSVSACDGLETLSLSDPDYTTVGDPDYQNNFIKCAATASRVCERPADQLTSCSAADSICNGVVFQNDCGHYVQAARSLSGASNTYGKFSRRQIFWDEDCPVDQDRIFNSQDPLTTALDALLGVLVVSVVFSICMIAFTIYEFCQLSTSGARVVYLSISGKEVFSVFTAFLILGPLIAALVTVKQVSNLYEEIGSGHCSDSLTNYTFKYLGEELPAIYAKTVGQIVMQCTLCAFSAAMLFRKSKKIKQGAKVAPATEHVEMVQNGNASWGAAAPTPNGLQPQINSQPQSGQNMMIMPQPQQGVMQPSMMQPQQGGMQPSMMQQPQPQQGGMQPMSYQVQYVQQPQPGQNMMIMHQPGMQPMNSYYPQQQFQQGGMQPTMMQQSQPQQGGMQPMGYQVQYAQQPY